MISATLLLALLGCPRSAPVPATSEALPAGPVWFAVEVGKEMCISDVPSAEPMAEADRSALGGAVRAILDGDPEGAAATLGKLPDHPAVQHARAVLGLLMGRDGAVGELAALSETHPQDACMGAMAAIGAATAGDAPAAVAALERARAADPDDARVAFLAWWLGMEDEEALIPALEHGVEREPDHPGFALAVGTHRLRTPDGTMADPAPPEAVALLERALDGGMLEAAGILLTIYRREDRLGSYVALGSRLGILSDRGAIGEASDPEAAYDAAIGLEPGKALDAVFHTSVGTFSCRLLPRVAPLAVGNFVGFARGTAQWLDPRDGTEGKGALYDGTVFHRVIPGFMIQGGDPLGSGMGGPGFTYPDEIDPELRFDRPGRLALANQGPHTNGSQFFVTEVPVEHLDGRHTIFGECDEAAVAMVTKIAGVERDADDKPVQPVTIERIEIVAVDGAAGE